MVPSAWRLLILCVVVSAASPLPAFADWQFAPFLGFTFHGSTTFVDLEGGTAKTHLNLGGSVTLIGRGPLGVEGLVSYTPGAFEDKDSALTSGNLPVVTGSRTLAVMGNVVFAAPRRWNEYGLRPFVSGGIGLLRASKTEIIDIFTVSKNLTGFNAGGGAVGLVTDRVGVRFDLRYFSNLHRVDEAGQSFGRIHLSYWTTDIGVVFRY